VGRRARAARVSLFRVGTDEKETPGTAAAHLRGDFEALAVVRALLVEQLVDRGGAEIALGQLLQERLVVVGRFPLGGRLDLRPHVSLDEPSCRVHPAVEVDRGHQRLEHIGQQRRRHAGVGDHALAQDQTLFHAQGPAELRARLAADDHRLDLRQVPLQVLGKPVVEQVADDGAQDGVAEELETLVGNQAVLRAGSVRQRGPQKVLVAELVVDPPLAQIKQLAQIFGRQGMGVDRHGRFWGRVHGGPPGCVSLRVTLTGEKGFVNARSVFALRRGANAGPICSCLALPSGRKSACRQLSV